MSNPTVIGLDIAKNERSMPNFAPTWYGAGRASSFARTRARETPASRAANVAMSVFYGRDLL